MRDVRWLLVLVMLGMASVVEAQAGSPAGPVPPELLTARRARLAERLEQGIAVLRSAEPRSVEGDYPQDSDFRQDNDFFYLTGLETAGSWLVLIARPGEPAEAILYVPERNPTEETWTGPKLGPGPEAEKLTGIRAVRSAAKAVAEINALIADPDSRARHGGLWIDEPMSDGGVCARQVNRSRCMLDRFYPELRVPQEVTARSLNAPLGQLRLVKDADELSRLRRAIDITAEAHRAAMAVIRPGVWEYEVEATIEYEFRRRGAERVGFPSIVGTGPNATVLHYDKSRRQSEAGDLMVMDIGAEFGYYSADVTRTVPVNGSFSRRQRELYELVLATQQAAIDAVRPGITIGELNRIARDYMRDNSGNLCAPGSCERYFAHGLSHWLGMDVHDVGDYNTPLVAGMVLTIEPGIYIPAENIGIRIEDDVLVTERGHELLSGRAPRTVAEIEAAMKAGQSSRTH